MADQEISAKKVRCRSCDSQDTRPSHQRLFRDNLLRLLRLVPYRCDACGKRFYAREPRKKH
jgi:hypothetical protein